VDDPPYGIGVPQYGLSEPVERELPAMSITMIGLDTAKWHCHANGHWPKRFGWGKLSG